MTAAELINSMIPMLKKGDHVDTAMEIMQDFQVSHLPVVDNGLYLGMIAYEQLELKDQSEILADITLESELAVVDQNVHVFEIVRTMAENNTTLVSVVDSERNYLGIVSQSDVIEALAHSYTVQGEGAVLVIEMYMRDLSVSEISRILEAENVKITGLITQVHEEDPAKIYVTLKLNNRDSSRALATLERFDYKIIAEYDVDRNHDIDSARLNNLIRFLNV